MTPQGIAHMLLIVRSCSLETRARAHTDPMPSRAGNPENTTNTAAAAAAPPPQTQPLEPSLLLKEANQARTARPLQNSNPENDAGASATSGNATPFPITTAGALRLHLHIQTHSNRTRHTQTNTRASQEMLFFTSTTESQNQKTSPPSSLRQEKKKEKRNPKKGKTPSINSTIPLHSHTANEPSRKELHHHIQTGKE
jgi:hypothetical protein